MSDPVSKRAPVTTHILDLTRGRPAADVAVRLYAEDRLLASGVTNADGRVEHWESRFEVAPGKHRLEFDVQPWFEAKGESSFYEDIHIAFRIQDVAEHYHVPLLLSAYGYSTYRGS